MRMIGFMFSVAVLLGGLAVGQAGPSDKPTATVITLEELDCAGCAKNVAVKLQAVKGVEKVEPNLKAKTMTVTAKANETVSPKAMWEAIELSGHKPVKMAGPGGSFVSKPKD